MKTEELVTNIDTVEELTVHALERTSEGLRQLREDSINCARSFSTESETDLRKLSDLAQNLRDFNVFASDILDLFQIDPETMGDETGNLKMAEAEFQDILNSLLAGIGATDAAVIRTILEDRLPENLERFEKLLPIVRDYVNDEYIAQ